MREIQELFNEIGKSEINEFYENLVFGGHIDSMDIINLVSLIESKFNIEINIEDIIPENFYNFMAIKMMIDKNKGII